MKFKLQKDNKYKGYIRTKELLNKVILKVKNKRFFLNVISLSIGALLIFSTNLIEDNIYNLYSNFDNASNLYYLSGQMEYDVNKFKLFLFSDEYNDVYKKMEDKYNEMSKHEKRQFVLNVFCNIVNNNTEFTDKEKEILMENEGSFLLRYGNNYEFENIFDMSNRLNHIRVLRNQNLNEEDTNDNTYTSGCYTSQGNRIKIDTNADIGVIGHEVEHAISINNKNGSFPSFILEAIDSSTDLCYYERDSYCNTMRCQILFLSEIIGKDNLIKCYLNNDYELLTKLIGSHSKDLIDLFDRELKAYKESEISEDLEEEAAELLRKIYEEKFEQDIDKDVRVSIIYKSLLPNTNISTNETMFYTDTFTYDKKREILFRNINSSSRHYVTISHTLDDKDVVVKKAFKFNKNIKTNFMGANKLRYLVTPDLYNSIVNSDNPTKELVNYLKGIGIKDIEFWTYNILNGYNSIATNIDYGSIYDSKNFYNDLSTIYRDKYNYLKDNNKLHEICNNIGLVFNNEKGEDRLNTDLLNTLIFKCFNYDYKGLSYKEVLSKYYNLCNKEMFNKIGDVQLKKMNLLFNSDVYFEAVNQNNIYVYLKRMFSLITNDEYQINQAIFYLLNDKDKMPLDNDIIIDILSDKIYNSDNIVVDYCDINELLNYDGNYLILSKRIKDKYNETIDLFDYKGFFWKKKNYENNNESIIGFDRKCKYRKIILPNVGVDYVFTTDIITIDDNGEEVVEFIEPNEIKYLDNNLMELVFHDANYEVIHITGNDRWKNLVELGIKNDKSKLAR